MAELDDRFWDAPDNRCRFTSAAGREGLSPLASNMAMLEVADQSGGICAVRLEREMAGVEKMHILDANANWPSVLGR